LLAMYSEARAGTTVTPSTLGYTHWVGNLPSLFAPSPRLANYGPTAGLGHIYTSQTSLETMNTFGLVLSVLAALGLIVSWRRLSARLLALLWLGGAALGSGRCCTSAPTCTCPWPSTGRARGCPFSCPTPGSCAPPGCRSSARPTGWRCSAWWVPPCWPGRPARWTEAGPAAHPAWDTRPSPASGR
jgi:hypothetical protein